MTVLQNDNSYWKNVHAVFSFLRKKNFPLVVLLFLFLTSFFLFISHLYFLQIEQSLRDRVSLQKIELNRLQQKDFLKKKFEKDQLNKNDTFIKFYKSQFYKQYDSFLLNKKIKQIQKRHKIKKIVMTVSTILENWGELKVCNHQVDLSFQKNSINESLKVIKDIESKMPGIIKMKKYQVKRQLVQKKQKKKLLYNVKVAFDWLVLVE